MRFGGFKRGAAESFGEGCGEKKRERRPEKNSKEDMLATNTMHD